MDTESFLSVVDEYNFAKAGEICCSNGQVRFVLSGQHTGDGFVYMWVELFDQQFHIVYVGMAGKTLKARCRDHKRGFTNSSTGKAHFIRFKAGFEAEKKYEIYARKPELGEILGESQIPMLCVEELAFIKKFQPLWNSAGYHLLREDAVR